MKKNVKINNILSAYGIAGAILANSTPVSAAKLAIDAKAQNQQNSVGAPATPVTQAQISNTPLANTGASTTNFVTTVTETVDVETENTTDYALEPIDFDVKPFTLYGENNPTKDEANLPSNKKYADAGFDKNNDGFIDLSEKIEYEIKATLAKTLSPIGKNIVVQDPTTGNINPTVGYDVYNIDPSITDSTPITIDNALKDAINKKMGGGYFRCHCYI